MHALDCLLAAAWPSVCMFSHNVICEASHSDSATGKSHERYFHFSSDMMRCRKTFLELNKTAARQYILYYTQTCVIDNNNNNTNNDKTLELGLVSELQGQAQAGCLASVGLEGGNRQNNQQMNVKKS